MNRRDWLVRASAVLAALHVVKKDSLSFPDAPVVPPVTPTVGFARETYFASDRAGALSEYPIIGSRTSPAVFFGQRPRMQLALSVMAGEHSKMLMEAYFKEHVLSVEHNGVSCRMIVTKVHGVLNPTSGHAFDFVLTEVFHAGEYQRIVPFSLDRALRSAVVHGETSVLG